MYDLKCYLLNFSYLHFQGKMKADKNRQRIEEEFIEKAKKSILQMNPQELEDVIHDMEMEKKKIEKQYQHFNVSTDEGSFDTGILVAIWFLLVFNKYQRGRGLVKYLFAFVSTKDVL